MSPDFMDSCYATGKILCFRGSHSVTTITFNVRCSLISRIFWTSSLNYQFDIRWRPSIVCPSRDIVQSTVALCSSPFGRKYYVRRFDKLGDYILTYTIMLECIRNIWNSYIWKLWCENTAKNDFISSTFKGEQAKHWCMNLKFHSWELVALK